jgi:hypothetical protein
MLEEYKTEIEEMQNSILPGWSASSQAHHNNKKLFQFVYYCLLAVLVFEVIIYDGNFTNDDPPFHVSQSWIVPTYHCIETKLIKCFGETVYQSIIDNFKSNPRSPPPHSPQKFILEP